MRLTAPAVTPPSRDSFSRDIANAQLPCEVIEGFSEVCRSLSLPSGSIARGRGSLKPLPLRRANGSWRCR